MNGINVFGFFAGTICLILLISFFSYSIYINYQYERSIGAYFDNAEDCITPECILIQLNSGYEAIKKSGLTEDDYGVLIFKKPSNKMEFQFQHLDAIIERAKSVQEWKNKIYSNNTQGETMKDVYTEKMDNLRSYVTGISLTQSSINYGRSDWIAEDSWYLKNHKILYFRSFIYLFLLLMTIFLYRLVGVEY